MLSRGRVLIAPAYLFACLILGGSAQGIWQNMILQLTGVAIITWATFDKDDEPIERAGTALLTLLIIAIAVVAIQWIPLPPAVWSHLGPRTAVATGIGALGLAIPPEPLSLTPAAGLDSLLKLIPPLALFCAMLRRAYRPQWLAIALIAAAIGGIGLSALQVASFRPDNADQSAWYLYEDTNLGKGVGFFANADHMATLLIICIPFLAAIVAAGERASVQRYSALVAVAAGLAVVIIVGLALNGSLAGYGLALPVMAASALIVLRRRSRLRLWILGATAALLIGAVTALEITPIGSRTVGEHATTSVQSRVEILSTTWEAIREFMPFGSGLGSFQSVYPLYERTDRVTSTYVVHAHNDYAELALELGVAGTILMLLFVMWWTFASWKVWRTAEASPFARAASIASAAILIHSLVDFPLRTAAISTCFAMCLAFLARQPLTPIRATADLRRTRHVRI